MIKKIIHKYLLTPFKLHLLKDDQLIAHQKWIKDKGDEVLRLNYPLNEYSIVFDLGGYKGEFSEKIYNKYNCTIYIFEPVPSFFNIIREKFSNNQKIHVFNYGLSSKNSSVEINISDDGSSIYQESKKKELIQLKSISDFIIEHNINKINLLKINIEGGEFDVLTEVLETGFVQNIDDIQVQFHSFVDNAMQRREDIRERLKRTHELSYDYFFVWENHKRK